MAQSPDTVIDDSPNHENIECIHSSKGGFNGSADHIREPGERRNSCIIEN